MFSMEEKTELSDLDSARKSQTQIPKSSNVHKTLLISVCCSMSAQEAISDMVKEAEESLKKNLGQFQSHDCRQVITQASRENRLAITKRFHRNKASFWLCSHLHQ